MSPKKSAASQKSELQAAPGGESARVSESGKSRVEPLAGAPQRSRGLSGAGEPGETTTEVVWAQYHKARKAKKVEDLESLRNLLMERHQPLVRYIAERLLQTLPKSIELDDLISWGNFGLMDAIRGFEPERNIKFKTYCTTRIRGAILDHLRSQDWVPRLVRLKASRIERAY